VPSEFDSGLLVGLLIGEGHFGGDGRQPQVTLRMHSRHRALFEWLVHTFPGGRLFGPYFHDGRDYLQWMARGNFLRDTLVPLLDAHLTEELDQHAYGRYQEMKGRYHRRLTVPPMTTAATSPGQVTPAGMARGSAGIADHSPGTADARHDAPPVARPPVPG